MKKNLLFVLSILFCILFNFNLFAKTDNNCLKYFDIRDSLGNSANPDSVLIDSCTTSKTYLNLFSKGPFPVRFKENVLPRKEILSKGTKINYKIENITDKYIDSKKVLTTLLKKYGNFVFRDETPYLLDTIKGTKRSLCIYFDDYVPIDSVQCNLKDVPCILSVAIGNGLKYHTIVPNDKGFINPLLYSQISGDLSNDDWFSYNMYKRGWEWCHYSIKTPLAWEMTYGNNKITIATKEILNRPITHPDMGNFVEYSLHNNNLGDGTAGETEALYTGHGLVTLSCAIGNKNNIGAMVGTCPDCQGCYTDYDGLDLMNLDVDGLQDNILTKPHVIYQAAEYTHHPSEYMNNGIVTIAAMGNWLKATYDNDLKIDVAYPIYPPAFGNLDWMYGNYPDLNDISNKDKLLKVIGVGGIMDGDGCYDQDCNVWGTVSGGRKFNSKGKESFIGGFNFSYGINKFDDDTEERNKAFIDIVVPATGILQADYLNNGSLYNIGTGTSQGSGLVAGVVGLMRSMNEYISQDPLNAVPTQDNMSQVHRNAYNILTFTADKIIDNGELPKTYYTDDYDFTPNGPVPVSKHFINGINNNLGYQFDYRTQYKDKLKRSWAQRMGFGKVNAYRAVAHSIRQKGEYEYLADPPEYIFDFQMADVNNDSRGYSDASGTKFMHFGSKVSDGTTRAFELDNSRGPSTGADGVFNVLEYGGVSLPGEFHNNQGVTRLNSRDENNRTTFRLPDQKCVLAIDGVLISDQPRACHALTSNVDQEREGKILIEGYLQDVEVYGNLRVGDLIVESTINDGVFGIPGCLQFSGKGLSEVYGTITAKDYAVIYQWNSCHFKTGSSLVLNGTEDYLMNGGTLTMEFGSSIIAGVANRAVEVKTGATLLVAKDAEVDLLCNINVRDGGTLILDTNSIAHINKLYVEEGGTVIVRDNAVMALKDAEHIINGHFIANCSDNKKCKIVGSLSENCLPTNDDRVTDFKWITTQPTIYMKGNCSTYAKTSLILKNTIFKNVSLFTYNVPILSDIANSEFYADTREIEPYFNLDYMVSIYVDNCSTCDSSKVHNVKFANCIFKDNSVPEVNPDDPTNFNKLIYRAGGVQAEGVANLWIDDSCVFDNLDYGVSTHNCGTVSQYHSTYNNCGIGDYDYGSNTILCGNNYNTVQFGSIRDNSLVGEVYNCNYHTTRIAYKAESSSEQRFRKNSFSQYLRGIDNSNTKIVMADYAIWGPTNDFYYCGKNTFFVDQINTISSYANKFITKECEIQFMSDIHLHGQSSLLELSSVLLGISGGGNRFSEYATKNISYDDSYSTNYPNLLDIKYNYFPLTPVRVENINLASYQNYDIGSSYDLYNSTDTYCGKNPNSIEHTMLAIKNDTNTHAKKQNTTKTLSLVNTMRSLVNIECDNTTGAADNYYKNFGVVFEEIHPNPYSESSELQYSLPADCKVSIDVYDIIGNKVQSLVDNEQSATGIHNLNVSKSELKSGVYFFVLKANGSTKAIKSSYLK